MKLPPFVLERWQSEWENRVSLNLAESGVQPLSLDELLDPAEREALGRIRLGYSQTNGTVALREAIAAHYAGATADDVLVTVGAAEANYTALWRLVEPGDEVVAVLPNYMQLPGAAEGFGAAVVPVWLREGDAWSLDGEELAARVGPRTRLVCVCNPNNPTGARMSEREMAAVVAAAARHGAWILADEVYRDAVLAGDPGPSFHGLYDRVLVTSGLSKAYGLPGLRIGWVVGPRALIAELWARRDYTTISPASLSDAIATAVLQPERRARVLARTRTLLQSSYGRVAEWLEARRSTLAHVPPRAGAITFVRYAWPVGSTALAERILREHGLLVVPGDHFGIDGCLRLGFGHDPDHLRAALDRLGATFDTL